MTDEQRIADAEHDREYGHLDPAALDEIQDRYERSIGWNVD